MEKTCFILSDLILVVSSEERNLVVKDYSVDLSKVVVVPNVIEHPKKVSNAVVQHLKKSLRLENKKVVLFVGDLNSIHNKDAAEYIINELAPQIWEKRKDVYFVIVGRGYNGPKHMIPNVIYTGFVKDLSPYLEMADVCIAPLRIGAGIKTKIIEYLAYDKPIVTTLVGAEGLEDLPNNSNIVVVNDIKLFKDALLNVLDNLERHLGMKREKTSKKFLEKLEESFYKSLKYAIERSI